LPIWIHIWILLYLQVFYMFIPFWCCVVNTTLLFYLKQVFHIGLYYILMGDSK
jgi:hypothetical protein